MMGSLLVRDEVDGKEEVIVGAMMWEDSRGDSTPIDPAHTFDYLKNSAPPFNLRFVFTYPLSSDSNANSYSQ